MYTIKVEKKVVTRLLEELCELNPSATFKEFNDSTIHTSLSDEKLGNIKIPDDAKFLGDESESCFYGFVRLLYNSKKISINTEGVY